MGAREAPEVDERDVQALVDQMRAPRPVAPEDTARALIGAVLTGQADALRGLEAEDIPSPAWRELFAAVREMQDHGVPATAELLLGHVRDTRGYASGPFAGGRNAAVMIGDAVGHAAVAGEAPHLRRELATQRFRTAVAAFADVLSESSVGAPMAELDEVLRRGWRELAAILKHREALS